ncbi:hypothetical protein PIIN_06489 [Serendipita indica DSM 11827]|uniref:C2H2-type domain-containing protein n=1 Tax=Serendipita indica (strain DSM 11827) TaxID=1109443 RepID=G4TMK7_SERID|nr:hypothetical protein PIIN_06489 [Serendipita indica DSM 11827]
MAYHSEYQHPYANYSSSAYLDHQHPSTSPASSHPTPVSPPLQTHERIPVPQSPSSFIYNRNNAPYPSSSAVYPNENPAYHHHHHPYHPHHHAEGQTSVLYRQSSMDSHRHAYPSPPAPVHEYHHEQPQQRSNSSVHQVQGYSPQPQHLPSPVSSHQQQQQPTHINPHPSSYSQRGQEMYVASDSPATLSEADDRLMRYHFPLDTQVHLRRALFHVLNAGWKRANEREPTDDILLQFTTRNGKLYQCAFWKADTRCVKEFDRKDRVLDHIRTHIDLQPFVCREAGCCQRFCSKPDLLQHEKNKEKTQCDQCGAKILPKNLARHKATALCRSGRCWPANP